MKSSNYKKKCSECGRYKHISEFGKKKPRNSPKYVCGKCGHKIQMVSTRSECKSCIKKINKQRNKALAFIKLMGDIDANRTN